jgi:hypothetical protein
LIKLIASASPGLIPEKSRFDKSTETQFHSLGVTGAMVTPGQPTLPVDTANSNEKPNESFAFTPSNKFT